MVREAKAKVVASFFVGGGRIYSIPCRASCFALVGDGLEETVEFILFFQID